MLLFRRMELVVLAVSTLIAGCRSSTEPARPVKLLVTNTTCTPGPCVPMRVLAFPDNQPNTPGGLWRIELGVVSTASACMTIPASAEFRVTGPPEGTTVFRWSTGSGVSLGGLLPGQLAAAAGPSTSSFVPMSENGWTVTLPDGGYATALAAACSP
jgi:hypothetical protein